MNIELYEKDSIELPCVHKASSNMKWYMMLYMTKENVNYLQVMIGLLLKILGKYSTKHTLRYADKGMTFKWFLHQNNNSKYAIVIDYYITLLK